MSANRPKKESHFTAIVCTDNTLWMVIIVCSTVILHEVMMSDGDRVSGAVVVIYRIHEHRTLCKLCDYEAGSVARK